MNWSLKKIIFITIATNIAIDSSCAHRGTKRRNHKSSARWQHNGVLEITCNDETRLTTPIQRGVLVAETVNKFVEQKSDALIVPHKMRIKMD